MKLCPPISSQWTRSRQAGFTMLEIAISLGVIAFALIAIIGILPTGLQTQRDNREETLVNQDARLLVEAIRTGGRDITSDIGSFVVNTDGVAVAGIPTTKLIQLLSDTSTNIPPHRIILRSVSGAVANRSNDLSFRYQVRVNVTNSTEFVGTVLESQAHEIRLRFAWPVLPNDDVSSEANSYVVRALLSGWHTNDVFYVQQYYHPTNFFKLITP
jgi:type II secretory pathway pseudopilin PulG